MWYLNNVLTLTLTLNIDPPNKIMASAESFTKQKGCEGAVVLYRADRSNGMDNHLSAFFNLENIIQARISKGYSGGGVETWIKVDLSEVRKRCYCVDVRMLLCSSQWSAQISLRGAVFVSSCDSELSDIYIPLVCGCIRR